MTRATCATINLAALQHNFSIARRHAPQAKLIAIVKANAYGHGLVEVARALNDADAFGVATLDEAIILREAGCVEPILLLEGFSNAEELALVNAFSLEVVIHHAHQLTLLEAFQGKPLKVWLKMDSGMHRLGFSAADMPAALARLQQCQRVQQPICFMTHLACADEPDNPHTHAQLAQFTQVLQQLGDSSSRAELSVANSAGILGWPQSHQHWVRPGIMLYGVTPFIHDTAQAQQLRPVMTLGSALIAVNQHKKGDSVGYGATWICPQDMPVGVVAIGYGDGYPRHIAADTPVLINNTRVPIIGRVSMDMLSVDLRGVPQAQVGDPVILWGDGLPVEEIAAAAETIGYELLCRVTARVRYEYI